MNEKSDFYVGPVVIGKVEKHPQADRLEMTTANGNPVIFTTNQFKEGDKAIYVSIDAIVPTDKPQFKFLAKDGKSEHRIKAVRLRGIFSMGLLIPIEGFENSLDVMADLGIRKYVPPSEREDIVTKPGRPVQVKNTPKLPVYGLDSMRKYGDVLMDGEEVVVTEKIHGTSARYVFSRGKLWVGSHKVMRGCSRSRISEFLTLVKLKIKDFFGIKHRAQLIQNMGDVWWKIAEKYNLKTALKNHPDMVLYGEIYGKGIQDMEYDLDTQQFRPFDVYDLKNQRFLDYDEFVKFCQDIGVVPCVPFLNRGLWTTELKEWAQKRAEDKSSIANHLIEGVVVKPAKERVDNRCGRVALKLVGQNYLLRG